MHLHSSYLSGLTVRLEIAPPRPAAALPRLRSHAHTCHCLRSYSPDHRPSKNPPDPAYLCVNSSHISHGQSFLHRRRCSLCVASLFPASLRFAQAFSTAAVLCLSTPQNPNFPPKKQSSNLPSSPAFRAPSHLKGPFSTAAHVRIADNYSTPALLRFFIAVAWLFSDQAVRETINWLAEAIACVPLYKDGRGAVTLSRHSPLWQIGLMLLRRRRVQETLSLSLPRWHSQPKQLRQNAT